MNDFIKRIRYSPKESVTERQASEKSFFNYELNRHHILSLDRILPTEHATKPLYTEKTNYRKGDGACFIQRQRLNFFWPAI